MTTQKLIWVVDLIRRERMALKKLTFSFMSRVSKDYMDFYFFIRSLPIPDTLTMDPLAPTALAVSSDFMDRIGSGLSLLRDHGKKVQKVSI